MSTTSLLARFDVIELILCRLKEIVSNMFNSKARLANASVVSINLRSS